MILHIDAIEREKRRAILGRILLFIAAIPFFGFPVLAQSVEARIKSVQGVALRYNNNRNFTLARGDVLVLGDEIDTRGGGTVIIELTDGSIVTVQPNTHIVINNYRTASSLRDLFKIIIGRVRVKIHHYVGKPNPYRVNSPTASILVRGTEFGVAVESSGDTRVVVYEGLVEVESLSDPRRRALIPPGGGVLVRPNEDLRFFTPGPGNEISDRTNNAGGGSYRRNLLADQSANAGVSASSTIRTFLASDYERYIDSIIEPGQAPTYSRFTAIPDSHFDSLGNPAYSSEFKNMEGRLWLLPSFSSSQGVSNEYSTTDIHSLSPVDSGFLAQGTFFVPLERARTVIGGAVAFSGSRLQSLTETSVISPPLPFYPDGVLGVRRAASATSTSSITGALMASRQFGAEGRTSLGIGINYLSGAGSLHGQTSLKNNAGLNATEKLVAGSDVNRLRFEMGMTHELSGGHKFGLHYSHGLSSAEDRDRSRLFNGLALTLDSVVYESNSSEFGFRMRGPITRRLFYGIEASWIRVKIKENIQRAVIVDATERETITRGAVGFGIGYALWKKTFLNFDMSFGKSRVREQNFEVATGNLLQDERQQVFFASSHLGIQTDVWRQFFLSASLLGNRQSQLTDLHLYPDRFDRRLTSYGLIEADGRTRGQRMSALSDYGAGWRFNPNLLAEYILSVNRDLGPPRHIFLFRYTFKREK